MGFFGGNFLPKQNLRLEHMVLPWSQQVPVCQLVCHYLFLHMLRLR